MTALSRPVTVGKDEQQVTGENTYKVGDVIEIYGSVMANGNMPENLAGTLTLPEGLRVRSLLGGLSEDAIVAGQQVHTTSTGKRDIAWSSFSVPGSWWRRSSPLARSSGR